MGPDGQVAEVDPWHAPRSEHWAVLQRRIVRALTRLTQGQDALLVRIAVEESFDAFRRTGGRPLLAAEQTRKVMRDLGAEQFRGGRDISEVDVAFSRVHTIVLRDLRLLVDRRLVGERMLRLRMCVKHFLYLQRRDVIEGLEEERARWLRNGVVHPVRKVASAPRRDGAWRTVVSVEAKLPTNLHLHPLAILRPSRMEAVVPEGVAVGQLVDALPGQAVLGPPTAWSDVPEAGTLAWRAAGILREGLVKDERKLIPCSDLVVELLVHGNRVMTDLLITKHLGAFELLAPSRRVNLASTLLHWLERSLPANTLARGLGIPPQTFHGRLNAARDLVGDAIDDPAQRLELIVALRAAIPHWNLVH